MEITYETASDAMPDLLKRVYQLGDIVSPRGQACREINNVQVNIVRPWQIPIVAPTRKLNHFIGAVEAVQLVGQTMMPEIVTDRVSAFRQFLDRGSFHGAYGARISGRLDDLANLLRKDEHTRQAVLTIYDSATDLNADKRDIPCTIAIQFLLRRGLLNMRVMMRSNDLWLGFPYDIVQFAALQAAVAADLDVPMGVYTHAVGSMHLYANNFDAAQQVMHEDVVETIEPYVPLWNGKGIADTSSRARRLLLGQTIPDPSVFEMWLSQTLAPPVRSAD
jgi:thymidylate synthase